MIARRPTGPHSTWTISYGEGCLVPNCPTCFNAPQGTVVCLPGEGFIVQNGLLPDEQEDVQ